MSVTELSLMQTWLEWLGHAIDAEGVTMPQALVKWADGRLTVFALAIPIEQAYRVMLAEFGKGAREAVFAFDRFTKPGQGTELHDLMAGWHLVVGENPRPFIVEYQHEPRIIRPVCWDNVFWNAGLRGELLGALRHNVGIALQ